MFVSVLFSKWMALFLFCCITLCCFIFIYYFLSLFERKKRWKWYRMENKHHVKLKRRMKKLLFVRPSEKMDVLEARLRACGFSITSENYVLTKRLCASALCVLCAIWALIVQDHGSMIGLLYVGLLGMIALAENPLLEMLRKVRSRRIVQEVYALSNQILYYSGSKMNLHGKLMRCLPHTKLLRHDLQMLLHEWYEDVDLAIKRFKERIGTEEGVSFAETVDALRLNESEYYYDLLRQRIHDYKEKMDLYEESKKESTSYVLFVVAGIPILNTFRVFIYPWVAEGQRLFDLLNG